jgi:hypothetical protein
MMKILKLVSQVFTPVNMEGVKAKMILFRDITHVIYNEKERNSYKY